MLSTTTGDAIELPDLTVLEMFRRTVEESPAAPALYYFGRTLTRSELDTASDAIAHHLAKLGVGAGDRVAISLQNTPVFVLAIFATWKLGAIAVPINPMLRPDELVPMLEDSGTKVIFVHPQMQDVIVESLGRVGQPVEVLVSDPADFAGDHELPYLAETATVLDRFTPLAAILGDGNRADRADWPPRSPADIALLTYTSGTTGPSKGAISTHRNLTYQSVACSELFDLAAGDAVLTIAPFFHITGLGVHLAFSLGYGHPMILTYRFHPETVLGLIESYQPRTTVGAITAFIALMEASDRPESLAHITATYSGGAAVPAKIVERYEQLTGTYIHNAYGLTETTSACIAVPLGRRAPIDPKSGALSIGLSMLGTTISIVGDSGEIVPRGEEGEIVVKGPQMCTGYWNKPEATAGTFQSDGVHTGDIGLMDDDGWIFVVDRKKDLVIVSGYKVWPRDVEDVLYLHPAVREVAVVGKPHDYRGETLYAYVSIRAGQSVAAEELAAHCRLHLSAYKCPTEFVLLDDLPKTATGKILRRAFRD